jgi:hypothetical protein
VVNHRLYWLVFLLVFFGLNLVDDVLLDVMNLTRVWWQAAVVGALEAGVAILIADHFENRDWARYRRGLRDDDREERGR